MNKTDITVDKPNQEKAGSPVNIDVKKPRSRKWRYLFLIAGAILLLTYLNVSNKARKREELASRIIKMGGDIHYSTSKTGFKVLDDIIMIIDTSPWIEGAFSKINLIRLDSEIVNDEFMSELQYFRKIEKLILDHTNIRDLKPMADFKNLSHLIVTSNKISNLEPLAGLKNLEVLSLEYNQITDLAPLSGLENISLLLINNNSVSDLKPLYKLTKLKTVNVSDNPEITKAEINKLQMELPDCQIVHNATK